MRSLTAVMSIVACFHVVHVDAHVYISGSLVFVSYHASSWLLNENRVRYRVPPLSPRPCRPRTQWWCCSHWPSQQMLEETWLEQWPPQALPRPVSIHWLQTHTNATQPALSNTPIHSVKHFEVEFHRLLPFATTCDLIRQLMHLSNDKDQQ